MGSQRQHTKIVKEIQKWMDEPLNKRKCMDLEYIFCTIYSGKIRVKVTAYNHQCWRHTEKEVLQKFSKSYNGKYNHDLVRALAKQHLKEDMIDEDYIISLRTTVLQKEFLKRAGKGKLTFWQKIFHSFSKPQGCYQDIPNLK